MSQPVSSSNIFLLGREDAGQLAALEAQCFPSAWDEAMYTRVLPARRQPLHLLLNPAATELPELVVLGFLAENAIWGYISVRYMPLIQSAEIYNVAVRPQSRGQGIASCLLRHLLELVRQKGIREILLEVRSGNVPAIALYARNGFMECGIRKGYYPGGEDAILMRLLTE